VTLSTWLWIGWIAFFILVEGHAIMHQRERETFSWQVWWVLRRTPVLWWIGAGFMVWLTVHFLLGGFTRVA
jgi:hypothetical protein